MKDFDSERIWTPDDEKDLIRRLDEDCRMTKVRAKIVNAKYYPEEKFLMVAVRLDSGELRSTPIHESCFSYHGVKHKQANRDVIEREMFKLERSFLEAKGKPILVELPVKKT